MAKKQTKKDKVIKITIISLVGLIILFSLVAYLLGYSQGKNKGYEVYEDRNNATIQELNNKEKSLQTWEQDLSRRESSFNNTEQIISSCFSNLQNITNDFNECEDKLNNPDSYVFNLNYSYNEINILVILFFFYLPITFTLFKLIIKDRDLRVLMNILAFVVLIIIIIAMGIQ